MVKRILYFSKSSSSEYLAQIQSFPRHLSFISTILFSRPSAYTGYTGDEVLKRWAA